jgi:hypothetical protein
MYPVSVRVVAFRTVRSQDHCEGGTGEHGSYNIVAYFKVFVTCRIFFIKLEYGGSQWPRGLRCEFAAAYLLGLRVRIPPGALTSIYKVVQI